MKTRTFIIRAGLARMLCMGFVLASVTLAAAIGAASASSPGELDQSFGVGGTVVTSMGGGMAQVTAVAILKGHEGHQDHHGAKGKANKDVKKFEILAGGPALLSPGGLNRGFALARYNDDGTLDTTWGAGGKVLTTVGSGDAFAWAMAIQHDRKIVQAGYAYTPSGLPPPAPPAFKRFALSPRLELSPMVARKRCSSSSVRPTPSSLKSRVGRPPSCFSMSPLTTSTRSHASRSSTHCALT